MIVEIQNNTEFKFDNKIVEQIAKRYSKKVIELLIIDDKDMAELNKNSRGVDSSTDVLSFPLEPQSHTPLGSIVINKDRAIEVSKELSHTKDEEIALLFIHGLLHLLGYDHETDNTEMRSKEEEIIKEFNLPTSLIIRSQG